MMPDSLTPIVGIVLGIVLGMLLVAIIIKTVNLYFDLVNLLENAINAAYRAEGNVFALRHRVELLEKQVGFIQHKLQAEEEVKAAQE